MIISITHEDFGYFDEGDFRRVLSDETSVNFLVRRTTQDLDAATKALRTTHGTIVGLPDAEENSPFAATVTAVLVRQIDDIKKEAAKLGFLLAHSK